jgi:HK97 gp10 family phage protein
MKKMFDIKVEGAEEVAKAFITFDEETEAMLLAEMEPLVKLIAAKAYADAPKDTGKGAASIRTNTGKTKYGKPFGTVTVGGGEEYYMRMQEYGTSRIPAKRFLRGAIDHYASKVVSSLSAILKRVRW